MQLLISLEIVVNFYYLSNIFQTFYILKIYNILMPNQSKIKNKAQTDIAYKKSMIFNDNILSFT